MIDIWGRVIAVLADRYATAAVTIAPSSHNGTCPMFHIRKDCNFALYYFASGSLCVSADPASRRWLLLDFHSDLARLDLERLRLRKNKRFVLDDANFGIGDANFRGRIAPQ
jgi:hypothetical protein